ncbi:hypothetical protein JZ751_013186 [Albula glossodonta]|uniref:Uncharacterized protein n=1 Tax=Albula glossodonta TaxID=121402 RepID=A0A8T2NTX5_9TELE|nr:hypothetical protein JZ751_013186 [Albula glossodonta]
MSKNSSKGLDLVEKSCMGILAVKRACICTDAQRRPLWLNSPCSPIVPDNPFCDLASLMVHRCFPLMLCPISPDPFQPTFPPFPPPFSPIDVFIFPSFSNSRFVRSAKTQWASPMWVEASGSAKPELERSCETRSDSPLGDSHTNQSDSQNEYESGDAGSRASVFVCVLHADRRDKMALQQFAEVMNEGWNETAIETQSTSSEEIVPSPPSPPPPPRVFAARKQELGFTNHNGLIAAHALPHTHTRLYLSSTAPGKPMTAPF